VARWYPTSREKRARCGAPGFFFGLEGWSCGTPLGLRQVWIKALVGLRPSFSSHVRFGERGAPVQFPVDLLSVSSGNWFEGSQVSKARPGAPFGFTLRYWLLGPEAVIDKMSGYVALGGVDVSGDVAGETADDG
jgi:hypothetical protein